MAAKTPAERKRDHRSKNEQKGLKRLEVWVYPEYENDIKGIVSALNQAIEKRKP